MGRSFPPETMYQVDHSVTSAGKNFSMTKRRVSWKYGTANHDAINSGAVGVDCRGSEHEIILVWSIVSGKRYILHDSEKVNLSNGKRGETKFQHILHHGPHVFTIFASAAAPIIAKPGFRQFELLIDGQSFLDLPHIYQLGGEIPIAKTAKRTLQEQPCQINTTSQNRTIWSAPEDLISSPLPYPHQSHQKHMVVPTTLQTQEEYLVNHLPCQDSIMESILNHYDADLDRIKKMPKPKAHSSSILGERRQSFSAVSIPIESSQDTIYSQVESPRDVTGLDAAFQNLVNLEDIHQPASRGFKLSMNSGGKENDTASPLQDKQLSLKELKEGVSQNQSPTKQVMNSYHANKSTPNGQLVIYGDFQTPYMNCFPHPPLL